MSKGGSIGEGGTLHAGHAGWASVVNPVAMSDYARGTMPRPSNYSLKSIVTKANREGFVRKPTLGYKPQLYQKDGLVDEPKDATVPDQQDADFVLVNKDPATDYMPSILGATDSTSTSRRPSEISSNRSQTFPVGGGVTIEDFADNAEKKSTAAIQETQTKKNTSNETDMNKANDRIESEKNYKMIQDAISNIGSQAGGARNKILDKFSNVYKHLTDHAKHDNTADSEKKMGLLDAMGGEIKKRFNIHDLMGNDPIGRTEDGAKYIMDAAKGAHEKISPLLDFLHEKGITSEPKHVAEKIATVIDDLASGKTLAKGLENYGPKVADWLEGKGITLESAGKYLGGGAEKFAETAANSGVKLGGVLKGLGSAITSGDNFFRNRQPLKDKYNAEKMNGTKKTTGRVGKGPTQSTTTVDTNAVDTSAPSMNLFGGKNPSSYVDPPGLLDKLTAADGAPYDPKKILSGLDGGKPIYVKNEPNVPAFNVEKKPLYEQALEKKTFKDQRHSKVPPGGIIPNDKIKFVTPKNNQDVVMTGPDEVNNISDKPKKKVLTKKRSNTVGAGGSGGGALKKSKSDPSFGRRKSEPVSSTSNDEKDGGAEKGKPLVVRAPVARKPPTPRRKSGSGSGSDKPTIFKANKANAKDTPNKSTDRTKKMGKPYLEMMKKNAAKRRDQFN